MENEKGVRVNPVPIKRIVNRRKTVFAAASMLLGIAAGALFYGHWAVTIVVACLLTGVVVVGAVRKRPVAVYVLFGLIGFVAIVTTLFVREPVPFESDDAVVRGRVAATLSLGEGDNRYLLEHIELDGKEYRGNLRLQTDAVLTEGECVVALAAVETVPADPFDSYAMSLAVSDIRYLAEADAVTTEYRTPTKFYESVRLKLREGLSRTMDAEEAGVALGLITGDRSLLSQDIYAQAKTAGTAHIFAVSGLHVGFLAALLYGMMRLVKVRPVVSFAVVVAVLIGYGGLVGFTAGVVRATVMTACLGLARITGRRYDALSALAAAVIVLSLIDPTSLFQVGFQLSVTAVLGIVCFAKVLGKKLCPAKGRIARRVGEGVSVSLAANSVASAVSVSTFGTFGIYFVAANLVVVPLIGLIYSALTCVAVLYLIFPWFEFLFIPIRYPISAVVFITEKIAELPAASVGVELGVVGGILLACAFLALSPFHLSAKPVKITAFFVLAAGAVAASLIALPVF